MTPASRSIRSTDARSAGTSRSPAGPTIAIDLVAAGAEDLDELADRRAVGDLHPQPDEVVPVVGAGIQLAARHLQVATGERLSPLAAVDARRGGSRAHGPRARHARCGAARRRPRARPRHPAPGARASRSGPRREPRPSGPSRRVRARRRGGHSASETISSSTWRPSRAAITRRRLRRRWRCVHRGR